MFGRLSFIRASAATTPLPAGRTITGLISISSIMSAWVAKNSERRTTRVGERGEVALRPAAHPGQDPRAPLRLNRAPGRRRIRRGKTHLRFIQQFDQYAAGADHDDRAESGVMPAADDPLGDAVGDHLLDQPRAAGHAHRERGSNRHGLCCRDANPDQSVLGLVRVCIG